MLMKCKTREKEFIPPRKNILNCSTCIIFFKKLKTSQKKKSLKKHQKVNKMMMKKVKMMNKTRMKESKKIQNISNLNMSTFMR